MSISPLDEIADVVGGSTPSKAKPEYYTQKGIAWLTPKDLSNHPAVYSSRGEIDITEDGYNSTSTKLMPKGTVDLFSISGVTYFKKQNRKQVPAFFGTRDLKQIYRVNV